ncbi:hypothetical protein GCM10011322_13420 [Salinarimonas ramus]|uniref:Uncharacterized protein n=1 Tax=Salinarimonas ramus TaxID=690164 RepID=A0A917Q5X9_9HYPH|nr:hypothetical protein GCM10011322_13420 [Salinarimonas ramus]
MKTYHDRPRSARRNGTGLPLGQPTLFDWSRNRDLLSNPAVRRVARRGLSPALALAIAELAGLGSRER